MGVPSRNSVYQTCVALSVDRVQLRPTHVGTTSVTDSVGADGGVVSGGVV